MADRIYLDHHAGAPLLPEAREAMLPWLDARAANPGSVHHEGRQAARALSEAREALASLLGARPREVVFTGSGTEANNLAILGAARQRQAERRHLVVAATEHESVLGPLEQLRRESFQVTVAPVDAQGCWSADAVAALCRGDTALVCVAVANHELGCVGPVAALRDLLPEGTWLHADAAVAAGWLPLDVSALGVDTLTLSSHKLGGPAGIGALFVRTGVKLAPVVVGGYQERGRRPGVPSVALAAGMAAAARVAGQRTSQEREQVRALRDQLLSGLGGCGAPMRVNGRLDLPGCLNVSFLGLEGEALLLSLDMEGVAVSSGAACASGTLEPSGPIRALGAGREVEQGSVRFTLGYSTSREEIDAAVERAYRVIRRLRALEPAPH